MVVTPYVPVPDTNGEEWDRLEPASALDALVELILHGEYNNIIDGERRTKDGMELRGAALGIFQVFWHRILCWVETLLKHAIRLEFRAERGDIRGHCAGHGRTARSVFTCAY